MCKSGLGPNVCLSPPSGNIAIIALKMSLRNAPLYQTLQFFFKHCAKGGGGGQTHVKKASGVWVWDSGSLFLSPSLNVF